MKYIKSYNESIKNLLKPKSDEEIKKSIDKIKTPIEKLEKGCKYGILSLVKDAIENYNEDPSVFNFDNIFKSKGSMIGLSAIDHALYNYHMDIVQLLLNHPKCKEYLSDNGINFYNDCIKKYRETGKF